MTDTRSEKVRAILVIENCYKKALADLGAELSPWNDPLRKTAWVQALADAENTLGRPLTSNEVTTATFRVG
jgi:hypothetical protein